MLKFNKASDLQLQSMYKELYIFRLVESLTEEDKSIVDRYLNKLNNSLKNSYDTLNTVYYNPMFSDPNILFPLYTELESYALLNKFSLAHNLDNNKANIPLEIPGSMTSYQKVISKLLTKQKLSENDEDIKNKIIANILQLGWNPEINIVNSLKLYYRDNFINKINKEISNSCYFVDCTDILTSMGVNMNLDFKIHPYFIITATDDNYSAYYIFKNNIDKYKDKVEDYDETISIYLFFSEYDLDIGDPLTGWRSDTFDIIDKSHPPYRYYLENLYVSRMVRSLFEKNDKIITKPIVVKYLADHVKFDDDIRLHTRDFVTSCLLYDQSNPKDIIMHNNDRRHIISPEVYISTCIDYVIRESNHGY